MHTPMERPIRNAILRIHDGNIETGWSVRLLILDENNNTFAEATGSFLPAIELKEKYHIWESHYLSWGNGNRWVRRTPVPPDVVITHCSTINQCQISAVELENQLNQWLTNSYLEEIRLNLVGKANPENVSVRLVIQTNNSFLQKLPWHRSVFFQTYYHHHNISFCINEGFYDTPELKNPVKILAIRGSDTGINIDSDFETLKTSLDSTADIDDSLIKPKRAEFFKKLRQKPWDILFSAGHSETDLSNQGFIHINDDDRLSFDELKDTLKSEMVRHLKLVIINSCQGIGLAHKLIEIGIPNVIVMAQPIHDGVAHKFLEAFLDGFANRRLALDKAVQYARHILYEQIEDDSPCASSMPLLFQRSLAQPAIYYPETVITKIRKIWGSTFGNKFFLFIVLALLALLFALNQPKLASLFNSLFNEDKFACDSTQEERLLTCGDKSLMEGNEIKNQHKKEGIRLFREGNYEKAIDNFELVKGDPEALVFLNNSRVLLKLKQDKNFTEDNILPIAVVLPIQRDEKGETKPPYITSRQTLEGIAYFQNEINQNGFYRFDILLLLANDENKPETTAKEVAQQLIKRRLYGVIGHYSSRSTYYAQDHYKKDKMVIVSYANTAVSVKDDTTTIELSHRVNPYFYRIPSTNTQQVRLLYEYLKSQQVDKVIMLYSDQLFARSFKEDFEALWGNGSEQYESKVINVNELSDQDVSTTFTQSDNKKRAIIISPDAWQRNVEQINTGKLLEYPSDILIAGNNVLPLYPQSQNRKNLFATSPWSPNSTKIADKEKQKIKNLTEYWNVQLKSKERHERIMRMVLGYDCLSVLFESSSKLNKPINGDNLKEYLDQNEFQVITGKIKFKGSDRQDNIAVLITPDCNENGECLDWRREFELNN